MPSRRAPAHHHRNALGERANLAGGVCSRLTLSPNTVRAKIATPKRATMSSHRESACLRYEMGCRRLTSTPARAVVDLVNTGDEAKGDAEIVAIEVLFTYTVLGQPVLSGVFAVDDGYNAKYMTVAIAQQKTQFVR